MQTTFQLPTSYQFKIDKCITLSNFIICADITKCKIILYHSFRSYVKMVDEFSIFTENEVISALAKVSENRTFCRIAVMFESFITFLDISVDGCFTTSLTRDLPTKSACALSIWANSLYIVEKSSQKLYLKELDIWANLKNKIALPDLQDHATSVTVHLLVREKMYISISGISIICLDERRLNVLWEFRVNSQEIISALTTDINNCLYIMNGNKLTVISDDGNYYKVLKNDLSKISNMYYDDYTQCLVLTTEQGKIVVINLKVLISKDY